MTDRPSLEVALELAALGWHVLPMSAAKTPVANCPDCRNNTAPHSIELCPCLPGGKPCHGVRAATADPARITSWWRTRPNAIPGIAAGPSGLVLIDLDTHTDQQPTNPANKLLPGIDLTAEEVPAHKLASIRNGRDALLLLAELRGGSNPWPQQAEYQPAVVTTPSGGRHLWYQAPTDTDLRQALGELGWQIDIKAGQSYGIAPGTTSTKGTYALIAGDPANPGRMPDWLTREVQRVARRRSAPRPVPQQAYPTSHRRHGAYLQTVIERGTADLAKLTDGRKAALSALAYKAGGLLVWSGLPHDQIERWLIDAGTMSGLAERHTRRIVSRALANGMAAPLPGPQSRWSRYATG